MSDEEIQKVVDACAEICDRQAKDHFDAANLTEGSKSSTIILRQEGAAAACCAWLIRKYGVEIYRNGSTPSHTNAEPATEEPNVR